MKLYGVTLGDIKRECKKQKVTTGRILIRQIITLCFRVHKLNVQVSHCRDI
jgi:hypothetical protein